MKHIYNEKFNEHVYHDVLDNGLDVYLIPKTDFHKTFVTFTTNYGSLDQSFVPIGKDRKVTQPAGIAHFLEHKVFAMPDKTDAFEKLSSYGVKANAFTTFDKTVYLFSGTSNIEEALVYLLDFVQTPYFTKRSVEKEQGIILEELLMYKDYPSQRMLYGLLANLYKKHPINTEIIGTEESIKKITHNKLYQAYNTFYHPSNMRLTVVGNFDHERFYDLIKENQDSKGFEKSKPVERFLPKEPKKIVNDVTTIEMSVNMTQVGLGVKLEPGTTSINRIKQELALQVLDGMYFSDSSDNYQTLLKSGLINGSYESYPIELPGMMAYFVSSETTQPDKFKKVVMDMLVNSKRKKIDEVKLARQKKTMLGNFISSLNSLESFNLGFQNYVPYGISIFDVPEIIESITTEDVKNIAKQIKRSHISTYTIEPKKV
ncbi:MAG: pitrilysin family protein [Acholeplasmataceae bacterium]|nr:pitrilysin family protein [Acholeplasmataceae bacterium]